jgi:antitoxin VapB
MTTKKVYENGKSQTVCIPKECRLTENEVYINKIGDIVMLTPKTMRWDGFLKSLELFSEDFMSDGREQEE